MERKLLFLVNCGSFFCVHFLLGHPIQKKSVPLKCLGPYRRIDTKKKWRKYSMKKDIPAIIENLHVFLV